MIADIVAAVLGMEVIQLLPLALALMEVLLFERCAAVYGVPLAVVEKVVMVTETLTLEGRSALEGHHRPSGDVLLTSIAATAGRTGVAVVLTGMGSDGAAGAGEVLRRGGLAIAQDERSSVVFGMPKSAIDLGVTVVLSPEKIAACLLGLGREPAAGTR
ncbi:MAG: chemotaxis protein CheB [Streptosporangiaceae bacterium]